jgi:tRNA-modifying protein YgfZ
VTGGPHERIAWERLRARGADALTFLQGQLTQDLEGVGAGAVALLLGPDGVVLTDARVTRAEGGYDLVVPAGLAGAALARLTRFRLRVACDLDDAGPAEGPFATVAERVAAGWPGEPEFARGLAPQALGAAVVAAAVSFTKGCYVGQELVARLDSRGARVPFRLVRAAGPDAASVDAALRSAGPGVPSGVTSVALVGGPVLALGVAHRSLADGEHGGVTVETL